ncbi:unnamed protein product [Wickerhamomyces anomalus]
MVLKVNISSPEEIRRRKILKKGIQFTLLVCGEEGTGKASFINTLCNQEVISKTESKNYYPPNAHLNPGLNILKKHVDIIEENATPISLEIILTPGFGDNINNNDCTGKVIDFLEQQFDSVLREECRIRRNTKFEDGRPHACLYFIRATSKGLRELDVEAMKNLSTRVNVIPVISKSDTLTEDELSLNKALILQDIRANGISVYDFSLDIDDDSESVDEQMFLKNGLPFAVSGSYETFVDDNDDISHIREYPWELKESTHSVLYENFRRIRLLENTKYRPSTRSAGGEEASLLDSYAYSNEQPVQEPVVEPQDDQTLKEFLEKKKAVETYSIELKALEKKLRVSSLKNSKMYTENS